MRGQTIASSPIGGTGWRKRLVLLSGSCAIALLACEILARIMYPAPPYSYREPALVFLQDEHLSYFHKPNQVGWIDDGLATINSFGLRGAEPIQPKPIPFFGFWSWAIPSRSAGELTTKRLSATYYRMSSMRGRRTSGMKLSMAA